MARNKDSRFGVADGFDFNDQYEKNTQEVQYVQDICTISTRGTQGRKGCKMPRINMAFEPDIHESEWHYNDKFCKCYFKRKNE